MEYLKNIFFCLQAALTSTPNFGNPYALHGGTGIQTE